MMMFLNTDFPEGVRNTNINRTYESRIRKYFNTENTLETKVIIRGKEYNAIVDYMSFLQDINIDCFKCVDNCCSWSTANISLFSENTRKFIVENIYEFNSLTGLVDILKEENGMSEEDIINMILTTDTLVEKSLLEDIGCPCSFKPNNVTTLCAIHSIALDKNLGRDEIIELKPVLCSMYPVEIFAEDDLSLLYIIFPTEHNLRVMPEKTFHVAPCLNKYYANSSNFRRNNPEGFLPKDYKPAISSMSDSIIATLGNKFYTDVFNRLNRNGLVTKETYNNQQILKKIGD